VVHATAVSQRLRRVHTGCGRALRCRAVLQRAASGVNELLIGVVELIFAALIADWNTSLGQKRQIVTCTPVHALKNQVGLYMAASRFGRLVTMNSEPRLIEMIFSRGELNFFFSARA